RRMGAPRSRRPHAGADRRRLAHPVRRVVEKQFLGVNCIRGRQAMTNPVIRVDGIRKQFRNQEVLRGVSFEVQAGQTFALLVRHGAGRTTCIRPLLGLLTPDAGSVSILGINPRTNSLAVRGRVGYLAEDQNMFGWMTVEQIVQFIAPFYDAWDDALADQYLTE